MALTDERGKTMKARTVAAMVVVAGAFGGTIGALATAAVQSQANPQAIAAAVMKVTDQRAESDLRTIGSDLKGLQGNMGTLIGDVQTLDVPLSGKFESVLYTVESMLFDICLNTEGTSSSSIPVTCPTPQSTGTLARDLPRNGHG